MLPVSTLIRRIRARCHDLDNITYSEEEILDAANIALRFIRRTIAELQPSLLLKTFEGTIEANEKLTTNV